VNFYRKFVKPTAGEWIDVLRYNSMLSSPTTHIINTFSNAVNVGIVSPIEKGVTGTLDFLGGVVGKKRGAFAGEALSYYKGAGKNIGDAAHRFAGVMTGNRAMTNLDLKFIPPASKGAKGVVTKLLSVPTRFLEASDQFFTSLAEGGERAALELRKSKGVKVPLLEMKAKERAAYRVFRQDLFSKEQGSVLYAIDHLTSAVMKLRNSDSNIISTIAKFTVPFVKTPMNIFKQGLEYSPAGFSTIYGATNKAEQLSKAIIGSTVFAGAATMLASGRLTWGEPTSEKQRQEWRQAGIQPYSVKIGDKWFSYQKLAPGVAFPMAMVAVIDDVQKKKKLDDSTTEMILSSIAKYGEFLADQSYVKSIGDVLSAAKGGEAGIARVIGNYPQQFVPFRALGGWFARLTDNVQRKVDNKADFIDKQVQLFMMNVPGLTKKVPARLDKEGNPIPNRNRLINALSPVKVSTEDAKFKEVYLKAEEKRAKDRERQQLLDKAKEEVSKTGNPQVVGDTTVFMEDGEFKTKKTEIYEKEETSRKLYEKWKGLSDADRTKAIADWKKTVKKEEGEPILKYVNEYLKNDLARESGLQDFEDDWVGAKNTDRAKFLNEKTKDMSDEERVNWLNELKEKGLITPELQKEYVKQRSASKDISADIESAHQDFISSVDKERYRSDEEYRTVVDREMAKNKEAEASLANTYAEIGKGSVSIPEGTLASKNNNPGNLRLAGQEGAEQGEGGFARFSSPEAGYNALQDQIELDKKRDLTVREFISKYAPPSENDTETYVKQFAETLNVDENSKLSEIGTARVAQFMAQKESGTKVGAGVQIATPRLNSAEENLVAQVGRGELSEEEAKNKIVESFVSKNGEETREKVEQIILKPPVVEYTNPPVFLDMSWLNFGQAANIYRLFAVLKEFNQFQVWGETKAPQLI